jgi:hypothetical protein
MRPQARKLVGHGRTPPLQRITIMRPQARKSRNDVGFPRVTVVKTLGRELGLSRVTLCDISLQCNDLSLSG